MDRTAIITLRKMPISLALKFKQIKSLMTISTQGNITFPNMSEPLTLNSKPTLIAINDYKYSQFIILAKRSSLGSDDTK
jgi:hypothetical protein